MGCHSSCCGRAVSEVFPKIQHLFSGYRMLSDPDYKQWNHWQYWQHYARSQLAHKISSKCLTWPQVAVPVQDLLLNRLTEIFNTQNENFHWFFTFCTLSSSPPADPWLKNATRPKRSFWMGRGVSCLLWERIRREREKQNSILHFMPMA